MTAIGNKTKSGSVVSATGTSITIDGVTTNLTGGSVVTTDGASITIDGVTTPIVASDPSGGGTKLYNIARSAWELKRAGIGYFPSVADNGDGKIRITCVGHGLINGDSINIHSSPVAVAL